MAAFQINGKHRSAARSKRLADRRRRLGFYSFEWASTRQVAGAGEAGAPLFRQNCTLPDPAYPQTISKNDLDKHGFIHCNLSFDQNIG